jgi:hypothetical protein
MSEELEYLFVRPIDMLLSMIGAAIEQGIEPGYLTTSRKIYDATGWSKVARLSDQGVPYLLGIHIHFVDHDIMCLGREKANKQQVSEAQRLAVSYVEGETMFRAVS